MSVANKTAAHGAILEQEMTAPPIISENPPIVTIPQKRCPQKCSICGEIGHNRRNCPLKANESPQNQNALPRSVSVANTKTAAPDINSLVCWETCYYVVFDLETTGFCRTRNEIIQIGAQIVLMVKYTRYVCRIFQKKYYIFSLFFNTFS